jgi:hypothetical protein
LKPSVGSGGGGDNNDSISNVYLVNWQESPFPLGGVQLATTEETQIIKPKPETCDRETYTDPYDFNVAYIGGTDDYKIIEGVNRNITDTNCHMLIGKGF